MSCGLVLLEPYSIEEIEDRVRSFSGSLHRHLNASQRIRRTGSPAGVSGTVERGTFEVDHARFLNSLRELSTLLDIVRRDGHGGNRQALGQYGKILAEAVRIHLLGEDAEESTYRGKQEPAGKAEAPGPIDRA
jgi:hypothetical protein